MRTCILYFLVSRWAKKRRMKSKTFSCSAVLRSQNGLSNGIFGADFRRFPNQERYFGLVQGSTAPSSSESVLSGMARSMSKSIVLPKPWQRGQLPNGELKLKRSGSGGLNSMPHVLH